MNANDQQEAHRNYYEKRFLGICQIPLAIDELSYQQRMTAETVASTRKRRKENGINIHHVQESNMLEIYQPMMQQSKISSLIPNNTNPFSGP
jgi:hypothetical protein